MRLGITAANPEYSRTFFAAIVVSTTWILLRSSNLLGEVTSKFIGLNFDENKLNSRVS